MTRYGRSPWVAEFPRSRVPSYPRHRGPLEVEAVVVGGGLTGCATAYAFAAHGIGVALVEALQVGGGSTGGAIGWIGDDPGVSYAALERARGRRVARQAFQTWRRAALDFAALVRRLDLKCRLESRATVLVATTPEQALSLVRDRKARVAADLEAPLLNARALSAETALAGLAAVRTRDGATIDPYRACLGLATAARARGAAIYEKSPVAKIRFNRKIAEVQTPGGSIRTRRVIVATGIPRPLFKPLARHFWFERSYLALTAALPARTRQRLGARAAVVRDLASPPHVIRWVDDRLLVAGADLPSPPERLREKTLVQRTGQLMYELSVLYPEISGVAPAYGWDLAWARTADGLPFIGAHRNYPHHLFAFGDSSRTVTGAYLASRLFLRQHLGELDPADRIFEFR
ncbi:MAG: NAD(P)/FAD-dependent oxidoreductase [Betaproteobacteria bacterium]